jgi:hypothetical protein
MKKTLYIDMDNVLVDFMSAVDKFGGEHIHFGTERFPDLEIGYRVFIEERKH